MSNLKLVRSSNVRVISQREKEINDLELAIRQKPNPTDRDRVVFAYHFCRLQHPLKAQLQLDYLADDYFEHGIYRDLWQAMLSFSIKKTNPKLVSQNVDRAFEYFLVVRKTTVHFKDLRFKTKDKYLSFLLEFEKDCQFVNLT